MALSNFGSSGSIPEQSAKFLNMTKEELDLIDKMALEFAVQNIHFRKIGLPSSKTLQKSVGKDAYSMAYSMLEERRNLLEKVSKTEDVQILENPKVGTSEGDVCNRNGCEGIISSISTFSISDSDALIYCNSCDYKKD